MHFVWWFDGDSENKRRFKIPQYKYLGEFIVLDNNDPDRILPKSYPTAVISFRTLLTPILVSGLFLSRIYHQIPLHSTLSIKR